MVCLSWKSTIFQFKLEHHKAKRVPFWLGLRRSQIKNLFTKKNKKLSKSETHSQKTRSYKIKTNKKHRSIYSQNIHIYASSQSRLTQLLYQTCNEQYFETLKFMKKSPQIRNPPTNNMLLPHKITINKKLPNKITILRT